MQQGGMDNYILFFLLFTLNGYFATSHCIVFLRPCHMQVLAHNSKFLKKIPFLLLWVKKESYNSNKSVLDNVFNALQNCNFTRNIPLYLRPQCLLRSHCIHFHELYKIVQNYGHLRVYLSRRANRKVDPKVWYLCWKLSSWSFYGFIFPYFSHMKRHRPKSGVPFWPPTNGQSR